MSSTSLTSRTVWLPGRNVGGNPQPVPRNGAGAGMAGSVDQNRWRAHGRRRPADAHVPHSKGRAPADQDREASHGERAHGGKMRRRDRADMAVADHGGGQSTDQHGGNTRSGDDAAMGGNISDSRCGWHGG